MTRLAAPFFVSIPTIFRIGSTGAESESFRMPSSPKRRQEVSWVQVSHFFVMFVVAELLPNELQSCIIDDRIDLGGKPLNFGVLC